MSSEGLDARRRRLLFRCWHRGIREMDLVLGRFADGQLATLSEAELGEFEALARNAGSADVRVGERHGARAGRNRNRAVSPTA